MTMWRMGRSYRGTRAYVALRSVGVSPAAIEASRLGGWPSRSLRGRNYEAVLHASKNVDEFRPPP